MGWVNAALVVILVCGSVRAGSTGKSDYDKTKHVCIIGAGIAGASAAHFLSISKRVPRVTVFEKSDKIGGRIRSLTIPEDGPGVIEAGASIISSANILMQHFTSRLNLSVKILGGGNKFSLWNGTHVTMSTSDSSCMTTARLLGRYLASPVRSRRMTKRMLKWFENIYPRNITEYDCAGHSTVQSLFEKTNLFNLTQKKFADTLVRELSQRFIKEIVSAVTRVNYGQDVARMNGLSGSIAMAGSGSDLWAVEGGNVQVPSGLLKYSGASVYLGQRVSSVVRREGDGYVVSSENEQSDKKDTVCDAVIITTPKELGNISFPEDVAEEMEVGREFQQTVATFVEGALNKKFGVDVSSVLTTEGVDVGFTSIGRVKWNGQEQGGRGFWKVFSRERLSDETIARLFEAGWKVRHVVPWMAYPKFRVPERFAPFDVDRVGGAMFYTSPIESAGSAMEMSAIAGANAATLVRDRLGLKREAVHLPNSDDDVTQMKSEL